MDTETRRQEQYTASDYTKEYIELYEMIVYARHRFNSIPDKRGGTDLDTRTSYGTKKVNDNFYGLEQELSEIISHNILTDRRTK